MVKPSTEDEYNDDIPSVIIDLVNRQLTVIDKYESKNRGKWEFVALPSIKANR